MKQQMERGMTHASSYRRDNGESAGEPNCKGLEHEIKNRAYPGLYTGFITIGA